jgi:D-apiose dehydrogenase
MSVLYGDKKLRIAVFGTGWWSKFQIPAWQEIGNVEIVALYNRTVSKAESVKSKWGLNCRIYSDPEELFKNEQIDFADIITETPFHKSLVLMAAKYSVPVVCQKPVAFTYEDCIEMWDACKKADIPLIINENYRWQSPIRQIKKIIESGQIGTPFRSQIQLSTGGPFQLENQPFLKTLRHYVLFDLGVHGFDVARYLFGEPDRIYCQAMRTVDFIRGDDMAVSLLTYKDSICSVQLTDMFSAKIQVEGLKGLIELSTDYQIKVITKDAGTQCYNCDDWKRYSYMEPEDEKILGSDVVDAIVQAQRNILEELRYGKKAETTMSEYMKTMELAFAAIQSTITGNSIPFYKY